MLSHILVRCHLRGQLRRRGPHAVCVGTNVCGLLPYVAATSSCAEVNFKYDSFPRYLFSGSSSKPTSLQAAPSPAQDAKDVSQNTMQRLFSNHWRKSWEPAKSLELDGFSDRDPGQKASRVSRKQLQFSTGVGTAAVLLLISAVTAMNQEENGSSKSQTAGRLLSIFSIMWKSMGDMGKKVGALILYIPGKLGHGVGEVVDVGSAAVVLVRCLWSVLRSTGEDAAVGATTFFKAKVAAFVADLAAHENRRKTIVNSGGGKVLDWLLREVGRSGSEAHEEAVRALAHLVSDAQTRDIVLSRPHALPNLFHFLLSLRANQHSSKGWHSHSGTKDFTGKSMLVAAIMDIVTFSCEAEDSIGTKLPEKAAPEDIVAALQVLKEGGQLNVDQDEGDGDSEEKVGSGDGAHGIGIRVHGGTGIVGFQRVHLGSLAMSVLQLNFKNRVCMQFLGPENSICKYAYHFKPLLALQPDTQSLVAIRRILPMKLTSASHGLWDDLHGRPIAVPLAAWALARWAQASSYNRSIIAELDKDGEALLTAVSAPERSIKWHGVLAIRLLLSTHYHCLSDIAAHWSPALLTVAAQACRHGDTALAHSSLASLTACISRSKAAHKLIMQTGLPVMREIANMNERNTSVQRALVQALDVLSAEVACLPVDECKKWSGILLRWVCNRGSDSVTRSSGSRVLVRVVDCLGQGGIPISQAWLAMLLMDIVSNGTVGPQKHKAQSVGTKEAKERERFQSQLKQMATVAAEQLAKVVAQEAEAREESSQAEVAESAAELPMADLLGLDVMGNGSSKNVTKEMLPKVSVAEAAVTVSKAIKALTELTAEDQLHRQRILEAGGLCLLRRLMLSDDYLHWAAAEACEASSKKPVPQEKGGSNLQANFNSLSSELSPTSHIRKQATRLLSVLTLQPAASVVLAGDPVWFAWLEKVANGQVAGSLDMKTRSYALTSLLNISQAQFAIRSLQHHSTRQAGSYTSRMLWDSTNKFWPRYEDMVLLVNPGSRFWKRSLIEVPVEGKKQNVPESFRDFQTPSYSRRDTCCSSSVEEEVQNEEASDEPLMDIVFVHGLRGGPFKTWRLAEEKASTTTPGGLVEKIDIVAGKEGTCWPQEWLSNDLPQTRLLTVKYKPAVSLGLVRPLMCMLPSLVEWCMQTNLSQWSGATLPLQEVSSMLLDKLLAAGVGERPIVFITHSMGGLVVKQMLLQAAKDASRAHLVNQTTGIIFYSCPHFGSRLADMPWRIGLVLRPAPTIGELRSGSPRLEELNNHIRKLYHKGRLDVLCFSETKMTPLVEGYGGLALRMEVVPIESAYPGFGELVVLPGTDHVNSCKPLNRCDPAYTKSLEFLQKQEMNAKKASES